MALRRGPLDADARARRAFARRQWARRALTLRRVLALVVAVVLLGGGAYAVWLSPWLTARSVDVEGAGQLSAADVAQAARVPVGEPLARVDLGRIRMRVQALAGVASADVTRSWPHTVRITITERQVVAVVRIGGLLRGLDDSGSVFRSFSSPPKDLPLIESTTGTSAAALAEAAKVVTSLAPDLRARVDHVSVRTVDRISLDLRDGRTVVWGSSAGSQQKAEVLALLLRQKAQRYDVSVPSRPSTRG
ncbi:FtsQ-type POTRA domain-containing protein [Nocardioides sp. TRM66260-LWL]|uniref:cell division protein FtsQ/DivIB n=1 Tax=Nocardioides sp. TRM66260-LWL TaxID=2874478 RepID=UPI001CC5C757|nr:FtsQ-type POTRA domain-containing protein [Nocardioides sp. TRM66260-LWL]MBZ5733350.1 FtsQ-type POTRA domain-containing protein [Nocardioides sp. TRM66260-LWL]